MDYSTLTYDICRCYVEDSKGLIDDQIYKAFHGLIRARNIDAIIYKCDSMMSVYQDINHVRFARQVAAFFKKNSAFVDKERCANAAKEAFWAAEAKCKQTNRYLEDCWTDPDSYMSQDLIRDAWRTECIITETLGDFRDFLDSVPSRIRVTSGATSTMSRRNALPPLKLRFKGLEASVRARPYLDALGSLYGQTKMSYKECEFNRVELVPKNWKTDRTIACEPTGNLALQLALDEYIKERLPHLGVDLSSQCKNQWMAHAGSEDDSFVTIDLSQASDTVALNTVCQLLPHEWFKFADDIRCPLGSGFQQVFKYEKFSSMGNGCTFTIETLIFAAFCKAVNSKAFAVYGDDIIVPKQDWPRLKALLDHFGFIVNEEKSYTEGPFRESCGSDFMHGVDVTPTYLRFEGPKKMALSHVVNSMASLSHPEDSLADLLLTIVSEENLLLVPFSENSTEGVWITPQAARRAKVLRSGKHFKSAGPWIDVYKAYLPKTKSILIDDSRTLFLWHMDAARRKVREDRKDRSPEYALRAPISITDMTSTKHIVRSRVPLSSHKYVRKWVKYYPPVLTLPCHLYGWSDRLEDPNFCEATPIFDALEIELKSEEQPAEVSSESECLEGQQGELPFEEELPMFLQDQAD